MMSTEKIKTIEVKQYTTKQLALFYGVDRKTFRKWLAPLQEAIGIRIGNYYSIAQVRLIFKHLKLPSYVLIKDETCYFD